MGQGKGSLGQKAEVYDIELRGAIEGLRSVVDSSGFFLAEKVEVLLDNETAGAYLVDRTPSILDYTTTMEFNGIRTNIGKPVEVYWVLGHKGVLRNEAVDRLAKEGVVLLVLQEEVPMIS